MSDDNDHEVMFREQEPEKEESVPQPQSQPWIRM